MKPQYTPISFFNRQMMKGVINGVLRIWVVAFIASTLLVVRWLWRQPPSVLNIGVRAVVLLWLAFLGAIILLRWINPPTSAYMFQTKSRLRKKGWCGELSFHWVDSSHFPPFLCLAAVVFEDPNFPEHIGFAWGHMVQVWKSNRAGMPLRGASTISQQLVKNLFLFPARTYTRKIIEAFITLFVETFWSKQRILEVYLNIVQFDETVFGVEAAARHFFGKPVVDLNFDEASLLVTVLPNPLRYRVDAPSEEMRFRQQFIREKVAELGDDYLEWL